MKASAEEIARLRDAVDQMSKDLELDVFDALYRRAKALHHDTRALGCDEAALVILAAFLIVRCDTLTEALALIDQRMGRGEVVH